MVLTNYQKTGLEAAILAYLAAEVERFARTVSTFKEEMQLGRGGTCDKYNLLVSGTVLEKAWIIAHNEFNKIDLEAAVLVYMGAEDGRFSRTMAAFTDEAPFGDREGVRTRSGEGAVLENTWMCVRDKFEDKMVFNAIKSGDLAEVQLYVCVGVDVKSLRTGAHEWTPLFIAASENQLDILRFFVSTGHDKDLCAANDVSPLCMAAEAGLLAIVQYLVEQGADMEKIHWHGGTALIAACFQGHAAVVECLLDNGCVVDHSDNDGWTSLHSAAWQGSPDIAQLLFRYGANMNKRDNDGKLPIDFAIERRNNGVANAIRAEEIRRRDHGFKRDRSTIPGTEEYEAAKRPRVEQEEEAADESDDDDDDDDDDDGADA